MLIFNLFGVKIYKRRKIIDVLIKGMPTIIFCLKHWKFWSEGDCFERNGGRACEKCVMDFLDNRL